MYMCMYSSAYSHPHGNIITHCVWRTTGDLRIKKFGADMKDRGRKGERGGSRGMGRKGEGGREGMKGHEYRREERVEREREELGS